MNIMKHLGFSKKGSNDQPETNQPKQPNAFFTDKHARKEGETRIYNLIILDESGSMHVIREQALSGANETIQSIRQSQKEHPDDNQMLCMVSFSNWGPSKFRILVDCERIEDVKDLTYDQYRPMGGTPLFDAMGISITSLQEMVREGDHVLVTVITDGMENSSHENSVDMIKALVERLSAKDWVFTYIGANQDSERVARGVGIKSSMDFEATAKGSEMMWKKMNSRNRELHKMAHLHRVSGKYMDIEAELSKKMDVTRRITPEFIDHLEEGQVFVFGSNLQGHHAGGAARQALEQFGAIYGQGEGLQGRSYAIPTMELSIPEIKWHVEQFIQFADMHPEMTFLVTRVGCGIAGFDDSQIAPLFAKAYSLSNVWLPASFWKILSYKYRQ